MILLRFLLALLVLTPLPAIADPTFPKLTGRVVDDAHLLSPQQVAQLTQLSAEVQQASSRQFVVATIPDLQGYDIADYGYQLGRAWGIGQKGANNGIILIVAPQERRVRIEVGYGLEPIMTDALSNQIVEEIIRPKFKAGDMAGGIVAGAQAIAEQMKQPLEVAEQKAKAAQDAAAKAPRRQHHGGLPIGLLFWFIVLVVVLVPMLARFGGRRRPGPWDGQAYRDHDSGVLPIVLWSIAEEIGREAGRRDGWGGGNWGGGGSDWGGGGSGGGDDFSGGGGSFGGGGASGSW